ncbi:cytochrome P450 [Kitasatospora sp. NA04385]|uniref:cytochrome P450 family protein n=1 Tax=Kitasatospora sp. NA04385 TaxID=2742135 RepID=UPI001591C7D4|nr:cytochrome P450 [Kitasatospora sp. NA04385]QKW23947.1 cytochrome P450 [Kitasatospora sp. NA04385]
MQATFPFATPHHLDNEPEAEALLAQAPVVRATIGPANVWLALSYRAVRQVLSDGRFSREAATRPGSPLQLSVATDPLLVTSLDGERHARLRKLMSQAFSPRMVDQLEPRVQSVVDSLLDSLDSLDSTGSTADLVAGLCAPLPLMVICELLGVPYSEAEAIRRWTRRLFVTNITADELRAAQGEMQAWLADLVRHKRARPDDGLISAMVAANDEGDHLTEPELLANLEGLLIAGHETTVNQLGNSFLTLLRHPDQLALLRSSPDLIAPAVDELLRYSRLFSSAEVRVTTEPVELEGVGLGAGEPVLPVIVAANRDPGAYPDPGRFDITREGPAAHLAFGHGPHFCLGAVLARREMRVAIGSVVKRYPGLRLAVDESELTYVPELVFRGLQSLPVTW